MTTGTRIAAVDEVSDDSSLRFTVRARDSGDETEVVLVRLSDGVAAWLNYCQHWTDVNLDTGSGATIRDDEIVCTKHGATFETDTGFCNFGPCEGAYLNDVEVDVRDGDVHLTDDEYEFVRRGGVERDDLDRSTSPGERLGF